MRGSLRGFCINKISAMFHLFQAARWIRHEHLAFPFPTATIATRYKITGPGELKHCLKIRLFKHPITRDFQTHSAGNMASIPFKLTAPSAEQALPRPRLFERLAAAGRLIWVAAPAGSGKTSLMASWLQSVRRPFLWYRIDAGDSEASAFFAYLGQAAAGIAESGSAPLPALTPEYGPDSPVFARNFFRQLWQVCDSCRLLVIDDYQDLPDNALLHGLLRAGLEETPADAKVIVVSRGEPPPAWARLRLSSGFVMLNGDDLRLTTDECLAIVRSRWHDKIDEPRALALNRQVHGWAAGLLLMLERGETGNNDRAADDPLLFDFFAAEILAGQEPALADFLIRTALLPYMRPAAAVALTGRTDAGPQLAKLARRNLFTVRHRGAAGDGYEYHPLFRKFLLACGPDRFGETGWREQKRTAAAILAAEGSREAAAAWLLDIGDASALADLILASAPQLLAEGRNATLNGWIAELPYLTLEHRPWLRYYRGAGLLPFSPTQARTEYAMAYATFENHGDANGCYQAWMGVCATFMMGLDDFAAADPWLDALPKLRRRFPDFPDADTEAGVLTYSLILPTFRHPVAFDLAAIADRLETLIPEIGAEQLRALACTSLLLFRLWIRGDAIHAERLQTLFSAHYQQADISPLAALMWGSWNAMQCWLVGDLAGHEAVVEHNLALAERLGVHAFDFSLRLQTAFAPAYRNDAQTVNRILADLAPQLDTARPFDALQYHLLRLMQANIAGDGASLRDAAREMRRYADRIGSLTCDLYTLIAEAWARYSAGDAAGADLLFARAQSLAPAAGSVIGQWDTLFTAVELAERKQDEEGWRHAVREFLDFGAAHGLINGYGLLWHRPLTAKLCVFALEQGIEADYVVRLVRRHALQAEFPPYHLAEWPWLVRIRCLGGFEIDIDGHALSFSASRVPVKPLELLKALIGFGASDVPQTKLADALWPEADGDAARRAFYTNLHRLRGLLGEDSLSLDDGRLSLNRHRCWCDVLVLDALAEMPGADGVSAEIANRLLPLLSGEFLPLDSDLPWLTEARRRIARSHSLARQNIQIQK